MDVFYNYFVNMNILLLEYKNTEDRKKNYEKYIL